MNGFSECFCGINLYDSIFHRDGQSAHTLAHYGTCHEFVHWMGNESFTTIFEAMECLSWTTAFAVISCYNIMGRVNAMHCLVYSHGTRKHTYA